MSEDGNIVLGASVRQLRPKAGIPFMRTFDDARRSPKYSAIAAALRESVDSPFHERELSRITGRLLHFMEFHLGRDTKQEVRPNITKFPIHFFTDYEENGALYHMFHTLILAMAENKWDSMDLRNDERREEHYAMFRKMTEVLKRTGHLPIVKVFFSPSMPAEQTTHLQRILQTHGAVVVSTPDVASHIIYDDLDGTREDETDAQVLVRYLEKDGKQARVHWWYHPDSYDDWVSAEHVIGRIEEPEDDRKGPWHLQARWVRDLNLYHEWMNEMDYEMPETFERVPAKVTANGFSQVYELPTSNDQIAQESENSIQNESKTRSAPDTPSDDVPLAKRRRRRSNLRRRNVDKDDEEDRVTPMEEDEDVDHDSDSMEEEVLSEGDADGSGDDFVPNGDMKMDEEEQSDDESAEAVVVKPPEYNVPSFSTWFDISEINEIEKKAFPEYFSGKFDSKTPIIYQEIRNYFINTWREKPRQYLTVTSTRGKLIGDACAILRVHQFLEHWGLINNSVAPDTLPLPILSAPPAAVPLIDNSRGQTAPFLFDDGSLACVTDSRVFATTLNGSPKKRPRNSKRVLFDKPGGSESDEDEDQDGSPKRNTVDYHCDICNRDCSTLRFHCATQSDMDVCETCYTEKKYDTTKMQPRDFIQMKSAGGGIGSQEVDEEIWTESETLLLLEALEMYEDNWELVAEHVGSKNKDQCVMQFVRLPIEDRFLDNPPGDWSQPAKPSDMAPVEMLKKAGADKEALARVSSKTALPLPYSGRPLIYGPTDQESNTAASQALHLSALTTKKLLAKPYTVMLEGSREECLRGNFNDLIPASSDEKPDEDVVMTDNHGSQKGLNEKSGEGQAVTPEKTPEFVITTQEPYRKIKASLPTAEETANGDLGQMACEAIIEHLKDDEELRLFLEGASKDGKAEERVSASVAMAAVAGRADQLARLERAELDRLITMAFEIKANLIRIKLQHYESLSKHEERAHSIMADEGHIRFAREMRAHHRYTIRDPAAMPPLHGPIGAEKVHAGDARPKAVSKIAAPFSSDAPSTKLVPGTSIRTISKPPHMPHVSPAQYFAQQVEKARLEQEKAEKERKEQLEKIRAEKVRIEREKIEQAQREAEKIQQANIQQQIYQRQLEQSQLMAQQQAAAIAQAQQHAQRMANSASPYSNGVMGQHQHQMTNGSMSMHGTPVANGLNRPLQQQQVTPMSVPLMPSIQNAPATPSQAANSDAGNASLSTRDGESTGPKTPTIPEKATPKPKNRKRKHKSSGEKSRSRSKKRIVESEDEDRITVSVEKTEGDDEDGITPAIVKVKKSKRKSPAASPSSKKKSRDDTLLRLRIRPKKDANGKPKRRKTRTSAAAEAAAETKKSLSGKTSIPLKLYLKKQAKNAIVLRLRIRQPRK